MIRRPWAGPVARLGGSLALQAAAALFCLLGVGQPARAQNLMKPPAPDVKIEQNLDAQVPLDLTFRDEQGTARPLREYLDGKPAVLVLAYYRCPRLCSQVLNGVIEGLKNVEYDAGKEFNVITVSIDPRETPDMAAAKKESHVAAYGRPGADAGWHFLTGDAAAINRLADVVGFRFQYDEARDEYAHASGVMVLTPDGKLSRYFYGISYAPADLTYGLEDAAAGRIGSPVAQQLRLLCFGYDPAKGKYTLTVLRLVQLGGVLTITLLGGYMTANWLRDRRKNQGPTTAG